MAFTEYTYSIGTDEVMVHFEPGSRIPTTVYCYADSWMLEPVADLDGMEIGLFWGQGKNPLFFHANDSAKAYRQIKRHGYIRGSC